ncbi:MAG: hypothetical protein FWD57_00090 [Polyangiaceae bacterium]|nr:hypothetical protein [Polyangiaceae bacterium]
MTSSGKSRSAYEWLIVVEGTSDSDTLSVYLGQNHCRFLPARGRACALSWPDHVVKEVKIAATRREFRGVIIVVDMDDNSESPFGGYKRFPEESLPRETVSPPNQGMDQSESYFSLDVIKGDYGWLPVRGITVPASSDGCLETDLLAAYGFPLPSQDEYAHFTSIIKKATECWGIAGRNDGMPWWLDNEQSKLDKFMFAALAHGFLRCCCVRDRKSLPAPRDKPRVITRLEIAMDACLPMPATD